MTATELRRRRCAAQLLAGARRRTPPEAVAHLLGVQAQDLVAARLALRARGGARSVTDVDAALTADRSLAVAWLMRGTLHLVAREDFGWLHALTAPLTAATTRRRLHEMGVADDEAERAVRLIERAVAAEGPLTRAALTDRLRSAGIDAEGQVVPHLLATAAARGTIVLGPVEGPAQAFALTRDWLGEPVPPPGRDAALAELARRYLRGHAPATAADLARWSGLGLRDARAGLTAIGGELERDGEHVRLRARRTPARTAGPRLLPAFDPYVLGWKDRGFAVDAAHERRVFPGGGMLRPAAIADGRVVGTWSRRGDAVAIDPFGELEPPVEAALRREAEAVAAFVRATR
jgi:hypothetical protein